MSSERMLCFFSFQKLSLTGPLVGITCTCTNTKIYCHPSDEPFHHVSRTLMCVWGNAPYPIAVCSYGALWSLGFLLLPVVFPGVQKASPKHNSLIQKQSTQWPNQNSKGKSCIHPAHPSGGQGITKSQLDFVWFGCFGLLLLLCLLFNRNTWKRLSHTR